MFDRVRKRMNSNEKGFTLIEIAIVMVIVGLLIGGILKGQAMVKNAKIKRYHQDLDGIRAAWYAYFDRYGYYPGDDPRASTHFPGAPNGNGNGRIDTTERPLVFRHLRYAKLLSGNPRSTMYPPNPYGGRYIVSYNPYGVGGNGVYAELIPGDVARVIDEKYDDGVFNQGDIRANVAYTNARVYQACQL